MASSDILGGGTAHEFACNVLFDGEEPWNKWFFVETQGHMLFEFEHLVQITKYKLKSANDCKQRDPKSWRLFGLSQTEYDKYWNGDKEINAILLDERKNHEFVERWQTFYFNINFDKIEDLKSLPLVKCVLFVIDEYWGKDHWGIQLGQIAFYDFI